MNREDDLRWMREAIAEAGLCPPSYTAFSVGAILVDADGKEIVRGYSRETEPHVHAEEAALAKLPSDAGPLAEATLYSTLEPCSKRSSLRRTCSELVLGAGIGRVVIAWREPDTFVDCEGVEILLDAGVNVVELPGLADAARRPNDHLLTGN